MIKYESIDWLLSPWPFRLIFSEKSVENCSDVEHTFSYSNFYFWTRPSESVQWGASFFPPPSKSLQFRALPRQCLEGDLSLMSFHRSKQLTNSSIYTNRRLINRHRWPQITSSHMHSLLSICLINLSDSANSTNQSWRLSIVLWITSSEKANRRKLASRMVDIESERSRDEEKTRSQSRIALDFLLTLSSDYYWTDERKGRNTNLSSC